MKSFKTGADLEFFLGRGFFKKFAKTLITFYDQPMFEKQKEKKVLGHICKVLTQKNCFFLLAFPSKLKYDGAQCALDNFYGRSDENG